MLEADAISSDLNKLGPYYYESGIKLLGFETPDIEAIAEVLIKVINIVNLQQIII